MYVICYLSLDDLIPFISNSSYSSSMHLEVPELAFYDLTCRGGIADKDVNVTSCVVRGAGKANFRLKSCFKITAGLSHAPPACG